MQLFPCPFCGPRDETEFHFGGEADNSRPEGENVPARDWAGYLHMRTNSKGATREIWVHLTCGEFFVMERNTIDHVVAASVAFEEPKP